MRRQALIHAHEVLTRGRKEYDARLVHEERVKNLPDEIEQVRAELNAAFKNDRAEFKKQLLDVASDANQRATVRLRKLEENTALSDKHKLSASDETEEHLAYRRLCIELTDRLLSSSPYTSELMDFLDTVSGGVGQRTKLRFHFPYYLSKEDKENGVAAMAKLSDAIRNHPSLSSAHDFTMNFETWLAKPRYDARGEPVDVNDEIGKWAETYGSRFPDRNPMEIVKVYLDDRKEYPNPVLPPRSHALAPFVGRVPPQDLYALFQEMTAERLLRSKANPKLAERDSGFDEAFLRSLIRSHPPMQKEVTRHGGFAEWLTSFTSDEALCRWTTGKLGRNAVNKLKRDFR